jgi:hypothetical protein
VIASPFGDAGSASKTERVLMVAIGASVLEVGDDNGVLLCSAAFAT